MNKKIPLKFIMDGISAEKGFSDKIILDSVKSAILYSTQKKYKMLDVEIFLDNDNCFVAYAVFNIIKIDHNLSIKNSFKSISIEKAIEYDLNAKIGEKLKIEIKFSSFARNDTQKIKQIIEHNIKNAENEYITNEFKSKIGNLITGRVKKSLTNLLVINIDDNVSGIIKKKNLIHGDIFKIGDKIKAIFSKIIKSGRRVILKLDRTCDVMLKSLLTQEIPEINEGLIEIKDIARYPGIRSKVSVKTNNLKLDPVATCIGFNGLRIRSISKEFHGEKIEILLWDENIECYIKNIFKPMNFQFSEINKFSKSITILVKKNDFLKLIGNNGHNIKLINKLIKWNLKIKTKQ